MSTIYVTEMCRFLTEPFKGQPKQLQAVRATVSTTPECIDATARLFKPDEWKDLLARPEAVYRFKSGAYAAVH